MINVSRVYANIYFSLYLDSILHLVTMAMRIGSRFIAVQRY